MEHLIFMLFLFALGACVGSFLNVVVWRLPRGESLVSPPSRCPKCEHKLAWYDNIPVFGWLLLGGKCRYCKNPISPRYPIIEAITGLLFVFYYVMFFVLQIGPCAPNPIMIEDQFGYLVARPLWIFQDWQIYLLYMFLVSALLAASLIDAELFIIPPGIPWLAAVVGIVVHAIIDRPTLPGTLTVGPMIAALSAGAGVGLLISLLLWWRGIMPISFPKGEPMLEVDREMLASDIEKAKREGKTLEYFGAVPPEYSPSQIRFEMAKEMLFLTPPLVLGAIAMLVLGKHSAWQDVTLAHHWLSGFLGAVLGAMVGGFTVWITRILGTLAFGRVAMGLGDVHLMFGVGAVIGAGASVVGFFLAPFFGILVALYLLLTGTRREIPYGPYLSMAVAFVMLFYCSIAAYLQPGLQGLVWMLTGQ
jgi:leader peptidase (prepilin peptidase) / N-methyltransferase